MNREVWTKLFQFKVYIIVYKDPYDECPRCETGIDSIEIKGVASTKEKAEELIARYLKRISYERKDFDIIELKLDGELS